jgi:TonB family protein
MKKYDGKLVGILGAVIIHLIAGILFMIFQIGSLNNREISREYQIALEDLSAIKKDQNRPPTGNISVEQALRGDQELLNIARNLANQPDVKIDRDDYIDKVKEELIESGKLGKDNYIDEKKNVKNETSDDALSLQAKDKKEEKGEKPKDSQELASKYSGPTRIYYDLPGRTHTYLPIPIYKCEGAGKVVLTIEVNPKGLVTSATVIPAESTTSDQCLVETAVSTALISRFNPDVKAQKNQTGTLTYHFVAQ